MASSSHSSQTSPLLPKPNGKSKLWNYFGLRADEEGKAIDDGKVVCKLCRVTVVVRNGNTSNLKSHLRYNHKAVHSQLKQVTDLSTHPSTKEKLPTNQPCLAASFEKSVPYSHQSKRWKDLNKAVAHFICKDWLPVYTVEKEGFRELMTTLDPRYELPSRVHFSKTIIPDLYASTKAKVARSLSNVKFFAGTTDLWSSVGLTPYLGYTIHFIDEEWELQSIALSTSFLPQGHDASNIADALRETLDEWKLNSANQVCLTTDNGANIVAAAKELKWPRLSCFGHNLHLGITKALDADRRCSRALGMARKIVSVFSCSWKRQRSLTEAQTSLNLKKHSLISVSYKFCTCMYVFMNLLFNIGLSNKMGFHTEDGGQDTGTRISNSCSIQL